MKNLKIGFGGGCHWCTEAIFQVLKGVHQVEQGWIASNGENTTLSEAVIVHFNPEAIHLATLIEIHLYTHNSTSNHSMRKKFRSGIYTFNQSQSLQSQQTLLELQFKFQKPIVTQVYPFVQFKPSRIEIQNYYQNNPSKPFCERYIHPKLMVLMQQFSEQVNSHLIK